MSRTSLLSLTCLLGIAAPHHAAAQLPGPLSLEARVGGAFATGGFADPIDGVDAGAGYAVGARARWDFSPQVAGYFGYQRTDLACAGCETVGLDGRMVDSGFEAGAIVTVPAAAAALEPWLSAGVVLRRLEFSGPDGGSTSEPGLGFAVGAGLEVPLGGALALAPEIRYLAYPADFDFQAVPDRSIDVAHVGIDLGFVYQF